MIWAIIFILSVLLLATADYAHTMEREVKCLRAQIERKDRRLIDQRAEISRLNGIIEDIEYEGDGNWADGPLTGNVRELQPRQGRVPYLRLVKGENE